MDILLKKTHDLFIFFSKLSFTHVFFSVEILIGIIIVSIYCFWAFFCPGNQFSFPRAGFNFNKCH